MIHDWLGAQPEAFDAHLRVFSPSVALLQLVIAVGYVAAPLAARSKLARVCATVGWGGAVAFHLGAEWLGLEIGWFSGYMLFIASVVLLPSAVIEAAARGLSLPRQLGRRYVPGLVFPNDAGPLAFSFALGAGAILLTVGTRMDLPGAFTATAVLAAALLGASLSTLRWGLTSRANRGRSGRDLRGRGVVVLGHVLRDALRLLPLPRGGALADGRVARRTSRPTRGPIVTPLRAKTGGVRRREAREYVARGGPSARRN